MGLLDTVMAELPEEHQATAETGVSAALLSLLDEHQGGGLKNLADALNNSGLRNALESWLGGGSNQQVSPQDLHDALGEDRVQQLAQKSGMSKDELLPLLARYLPQIIDRLTAAEGKKASG